VIITVEMEKMMTDNNHEYPLLIAQSGPLEGQRWKIKSELLLGRDSDCDIMIPLREVSRHHARIFIEDGNQMVEDLNSKNGTYLNRRPIQAAMPLKDGDELQISISQHFIFLSSDATMPLEGFPLELQKRRLRIDVGARRVFVMDQELDPPLSASQFNLLQMLFASPGEVITRPDIIEGVWGTSAEGVTEQALDALVRRLRYRLAAIDPTTEYITTVRGHGLRLDNPFNS
jgi:hypothetical protein